MLQYLNIYTLTNLQSHNHKKKHNKHAMHNEEKIGGQKKDKWRKQMDKKKTHIHTLFKPQLNIFLSNCFMDAFDVNGDVIVRNEMAETKKKQKKNYHVLSNLMECFENLFGINSMYFISK